MTANNTEPVPIRCERCDDTLSNNGTIQSAGHPGCGDIDGPGHRFAVSEAQLQRICASERQAYEQNGVAWVISLIDKIHGHVPSELDAEYKGLKNTIRDAYKMRAGVDPAPSYPIAVQLQTLIEETSNE